VKASLWDRQWIDPVASTPGEVTGYLQRESAKWAAIVRSAGIPAE
jgi:tripartite-type tricarboxylate transporter receptor subunit TctC